MNQSTTFAMIAFALSSMFSNCFAQQTLSDPEITKKIIHSVKSYATGISCELGDIKPQDIAALEPYESGENHSAKYAVLWSGDIECLGGSSAIQTHIAILINGSHGELLVSPSLSSPVIKFESIDARYFPRLIENTHDSIVLEGLDYSPDDGMCCPSVPVRVVVHVDEEGNWKVIDRKVKVSMSVK
jgi:hypothetical protein